MNVQQRRQFLQSGVCGLTGVALAGLGAGEVPAQAPPPSAIRLSFEEALVEMVDLTRVYHWLFKLAGDSLPSFPGPAIFATEGTRISVTLTNNLDEPHAFEVLGVPQSNSGPIAAARPGAVSRRTVTFTAPRAGTYLYHDPLNAPVNRVMGLHGALVVLPRGVRERSPVNTPYSNPTIQVQRLFNDLGRIPQFPGDPWIPIRPDGVPPNPALPAALEPFLYRTRVWLFTQVDPVLNAQVQALRPGTTFSAMRFQREFLPRYFTLNGRSGVFAAHDAATEIDAFIGEPFVVRQLNAGLGALSEHLHANHFCVLAVNNVVQQSLPFIDSMTLVPASTQSGPLFFTGGRTLDWLVPLIRPPDIPGDPATPLRDLIPQELALILGDVPQSPLEYPMHNHMEQAQTAAGGNYPQGDITHFVFLGDVDKRPFPESSVAGDSPAGGGHSP